MDKVGELAVGADLERLDRREPYLRVAVRDGRLVLDLPSVRRSLVPRRSDPKNDNMKRDAEKALRERIALGDQMARLIDDAKRTGCTDFANGLEECFTTFINRLPKSQRRAVLLSAYDAVVRQDPAEATKLSVIQDTPPTT